MVIKQAFNTKTKAWVKFEKTKEGTKFFDVKQKNPKVPFKGIPKVGKRK